MRNTWNCLTILAFVLAVALACRTTDKIDSQFIGCITPNGEKIGVAYKSESFVLDAESGKIIKTTESSRKQGAIVCSPDNEVFTVYSDEVTNVETDESYPRRIAGSTIIGINSKNNLVGYEGGKIKKGTGKPLKVLIEKPNDKTDDLKLFEISLEKLDAVKRNQKSFLTMPVKLLDNNELLVFAGGKARTIPISEEEDFDPHIWGFYKVNLENGEINKTKTIDKADVAVNLFRLPKSDATTNGKIAAVAFANTEDKIVLVFDTTTGEEIFRQTFYDKRESGRSSLKLSKFYSIAISKDGSKLAIAGDWSDHSRTSYKKEPRILVYDLQDGNEIVSFAIDGEEADLIDFDGKEITLSFDKKTIAKINAEDGKNIWKTQLATR